MKPGLLVKLLGLTVIAGALFACMTISASAVDLNQLTYATNDDGTMPSPAATRKRRESW